MNENQVEQNIAFNAEEALMELIVKSLRLKQMVDKEELPYVSDAYRIACLALELTRHMNSGGEAPPYWQGLKIPFDMKREVCWVLVKQGEVIRLLKLDGSFEASSREEVRADVKEQAEGIAVWFEDERGSDKDMSHLLPKEVREGRGPLSPDRDHIPEPPPCTCHKHGKRLCQLHGKRKYGG